ncbi:hypothetical protein ACF3NR_07900 [Vaginella massiliensis]|uniref:hypothetical protein n=1 Tax=Vaginella massiliensis TaxID=1816680 RepID=UPI0008399A2A|nr:hypothetical protein [Vaginella massiliensis]
MPDFIIPILIFIGFLVLPVGILFAIAYQDAKKKDFLQLQLLRELPEHIELKAIVKFNIGRPQGRFLKEKKFQGSGVLYAYNNQIFFKDNFHQEDTVFELDKVEIKWHDETHDQSIQNSLSLSDGKEKIFFYVDSAKFIFSNVNQLTDTYQLYLDLKNYQSAKS